MHDNPQAPSPMPSPVAACATPQALARLVEALAARLARDTNARFVRKRFDALLARRENERAYAPDLMAQSMAATAPGGSPQRARQRATLHARLDEQPRRDLVALGRPCGRHRFDAGDSARPAEGPWDGSPRHEGLRQSACRNAQCARTPADD
jgi:hypothetical protein